MKGPDSTLSRLLRRPALAQEIERIANEHAITDAEGLSLVGDRNAVSGTPQPIQYADYLVGLVYGPNRVSVARLLEVLVGHQNKERPQGQESFDRHREVGMLYSVSERIIGTTDPVAIARLLCEEAERYLGCDSAAVLMLNPETNRLEIVATRGLPFHDRATLEVEDDIVAGVLRSGQGEIIADVKADPRALAASNRLRSIVLSPLKSHDRVLGVLVAGTEAPGDFADGELQALNAIAAHAASAIEALHLGRDLKSQSHKPVNLIYGVDERPPLGVGLLLGFQHVLIAVMSLAYPVLVTLEAGGSRMTAASVVSMSLIGMAIATGLQVLARGPVGSGFLAPYITSAIYLGPSLAAARIGGLKLVFGMTIFAGLVVFALSQLMPRFRKLFPPEVSGVVVLMVGLSIVPVALPRFLGVGEGDSIAQPESWSIGAITLGAIVLLSLLPMKWARLYATAVGIGLGYGAAVFLGMFDAKAAAQVSALPVFGTHAWPVGGLSIEWSLIVPFVAAALASSIKEAGLVISCQKTNDTEWKRPRMRSVSGGLVASGVGNIASGALGGVGVGISAGNVGLATATGATSRITGLVVASMFAALAFMPKLTALLALIPSPVMGAGLLYVACHLVSSGAELLTSRMLDTRRNYVVGLSLIAGIGMMVAPRLFAGAPDWAQAVLSSPLAFSTMLAFGLNLALNVGVSRRGKIDVDIDAGMSEALSRFFDREGASWGARRDVIRRAAPAVIEWCEELREIGGVTKASVAVEFDEFRLVVLVRGQGRSGTGAAVRSGDASVTLDHVARTIASRYECKAKLVNGGSASFDFQH